MLDPWVRGLVCRILFAYSHEMSSQEMYCNYDQIITFMKFSGMSFRHIRSLFI